MIAGVVAGGRPIAAAGPISGISWNPADSGTYSVENSNIDCFNRAAGEVDKLARAIPSKSTGKWYFEFSLRSPVPPNISLSSDKAGVGVAALTTNSANYLGSSGADAAGFWNKGNTYGGIIHTFPSSTREITLESDIIGIAFECSTGKLWFRKNGTWVGGDPGAGGAHVISITTGATYAIACTPEDPGYGVRLLNTLTYSVPTGFLKWE